MIRCVGLALLLCLASSGLRAQSKPIVCDKGRGSFEATLPSGVSVHVGPVRSAGFATRACEAELRWHHQSVVAVSAAAGVDIDLLGADLGQGAPVVAFVVRQASGDSPESYEVWSASGKPRLLIRLPGGARFRALDARFNGQVAIWATDAAALLPSEGLTEADFPFPLGRALQIEHGRLVDVSGWYGQEYDREIARLREELSPDALEELRASDGRLEPYLPAALRARLRRTEAAVLAIVWDDLYSRHPEAAWAELGKAWPASDLARVTTAISDVETHGFNAQVSRIASPSRTNAPRWMEKPLVYEYVKAHDAQPEAEAQLSYGAPGVTGHEGPVAVTGLVPPGLYEADTEPKPVLLWRPPPGAGQTLAADRESVLLIIDEAGEVQNVKLKAPKSDPQLLRAAKDWRFMPASRNGKPVAYRLEMDVTLIR